MQRRAPRSFDGAVRQAAIYEAAFLIPPTTISVIVAASALARLHGLQLGDCVVCVASAQAGAKVLLTEDMQDGRILEGVRLLNPFAATNDRAIEALFGSR